MLQTVRLPFVRFSTEAKQYKDPEGHIGYMNVHYAHITPAGGKDELVKNAEEWIKELQDKAQSRGHFDSSANEYDKWYENFSKMFTSYKNNETMSVEGTPIRACLAFTKAEIAQAESVKIFSLEDLSTCNEEAMQRMGIGARTLKNKATAMLSTKKDGHVAEENAALKQKIADLESKVDQMLQAGFPQAQTPVKRGRKPKVEQE